MRKITLLICLIFLFSTCASTQLSHAQESVIYKVGETGPAGGIVFYDKGENSGGWQYLEAAPAEFEFSTNWNSANEMCKLLNIKGFTGWRLPTKDELSYMYLNLKQKGLGDFTNDMYWSSTVDNSLLSFTTYQNFGSGFILVADRGGRRIVSLKVRAVREF